MRATVQARITSFRSELAMKSLRGAVLSNRLVQLRRKGAISTHMAYVLEAVKRLGGRAITGEVYEMYVEICRGRGETPRTRRSVYTYMRALSEKAFLVRDVQHRGRYGMTTMVFVPNGQPVPRCEDCDKPIPYGEEFCLEHKEAYARVSRDCALDLHERCRGGALAGLCRCHHHRDQAPWKWIEDEG